MPWWDLDGQKVSMGVSSLLTGLAEVGDGEEWLRGKGGKEEGWKTQTCMEGLSHTKAGQAPASPTHL